MYTRERCAPQTPLAENFFTQAQVLAYAYIHVKLQFVAPLTCDLRRRFSVIGFALKGPPKWGFGSILGARANVFGGNTP